MHRRVLQQNMQSVSSPTVVSFCTLPHRSLLPHRHGNDLTPSIHFQSRRSQFSKQISIGRLCVEASSSASVSPSPSGQTVSDKSILVVGGTGTLGRQVVRKALDDGYDVRCIVRPRQNPADFLRDWGATTVQADLTNPVSLPVTLVGIHTIIDCATARPEESTQKLDWEGKVALIQCAQAMGIKRYIFFSIFNCEKHPEVPLMNIKSCTEDFLKDSGLNFTIFRLCGFMQAIIGNYAVPILEENQVWSTDDDTRTSYLDSQDIARMTVAALRNQATFGKTLTLSGIQDYSTDEIIQMCEKRANATAKISKVPVWLLKWTRGFLRGLQWARDASDRLAFAEVLSTNEVFAVDMKETMELLNVDPSSITTVESYLDEYFERILSKLKEVAATSKQKDFYL
eukprot:g5300.t1